MPKSPRIYFYSAAVLLLVGSCVAAFAQTPSRLVKAVDENEVVTLTGNVHPLARPEFDLGAVSTELRLEQMILHLEPTASQQAELDALVEAQHDPQSPLFHQWLTPAQYGARFGVSAADVAEVTGWLAAHGFTVNEVAASNREIVFSGTAGQVAEAFHTEIHRYQVNGVPHIANAQDPQIPAALAGVVGGVVSLHDFRHDSAIHMRSQVAVRAEGGVGAQFTSGSSHYLFPADWATIYDLNSLYSAGTKGSGTSMAIVGRSDIVLTDVATFRTDAGLAANPPQVIHNGSTDPGLVSGDQDESTLDVEWSGAIAPAATVKFVVSASTATTDGVDLSAQYIVNNKTAPVMSTSYGSCEADMGATGMAFYNSLWQQAASEGISSFVSSGDSGAAGCYGGSATSASGTGVNGLCSSPYSTCVGGTEFNEGKNTAQYWSSSNGTGGESALSYIPEEVWNESGSNGGSDLWASGGGVSLHFSQPTWQAGVSGTSAANGMRAVPDVAMTAAGHDGYIIYESPVGEAAADDGLYVISGTSAAAPTFAAVMALLVQSKGGTGVGNANAGLYPLLNASKNPFHATPSGNNSVPGVTGFTASGAAYNLATGLGSVDGALLLSAWGSGAASSSDFTLKASASSGTVQTGNSTTFTIGVTESGSAMNTVALTAKSPAGVTVSFNPASLASGASSTVTIAVGSTVAAGVQTITITGTDATGTQTATYALTVTQPPTLVLAAATNALTLNQGGSGTVGLTVTKGGSYTGSIAFSATGLPAGVSAQWSSNPITTASGSSSSETLTLTAASTATAGSATLVVTAADDGLTASQSIALKVQAAPALTVTPAATTLSVTAGGSVTDVISLAGNSAYAGAVTLSLTGLPSNVSASWSSNPVTLASEAGSSTLTLKATSAATASTATVTLTATGGGLTVSKQITLQVLPLPVLTLTPASTSLSLVQGGSVTDAISLAGNSTYSGAVALTVTGLPAGVTASWSSTPVTLANEAGASTLTLKTASTTPASTTTITVTASGDGLTVSHQITLQVQAPPTLTVTPAATSLSVKQGASVADAISLAGNSSYSGPVTLSVTGLPANVTASWSSSPVTLASEAGSSTLTLNATSAAAAATTMITVTASGDGLTVSKQVTLQVLPVPTLTLTPATASLSVLPGASVTDVFSLAGNASYSGAVTLSVTGLPANVTASWSSSPVALANETGSSTLTLKTTSAAAAATTTLTVTATGDGLTVSQKIALSVTAPPTLTISPAAASMTVVNPVEAASTAQTIASQVITFTGSSSYSGAVSLSVSGLPAYLTASWNSISVTLNASKTGTSTLTITAAEAAVGGAISTVTPGTYTATVTATGSGVTVTKTIQVLVAGLVVTPASTTLTIHRGSSGTLTFTTASVGGASGVVVPALAANASPNGLTVGVNVASLAAPGNGSFTFTFNVSSTATLATYQLLPSTAMLASATSTARLLYGWSSSPVTLNIVQ
jgi:hypothetical protein